MHFLKGEVVLLLPRMRKRPVDGFYHILRVQLSFHPPPSSKELKATYLEPSSFFILPTAL